MRRGISRARGSNDGDAFSRRQRLRFSSARSGAQAGARRRRDQARQGTPRPFATPTSPLTRSPTQSSARSAQAISGVIFPTAIRSTRTPTRSRCSRAVWKLASDQGWRLGNADLTIFAEQPKLKPHLDAMRARLAAVLNADQSRINVKASSPEGLGALGRGEGMAAAAIVMLEGD